MLLQVKPGSRPDFYCLQRYLINSNTCRQQVRGQRRCESRHRRCVGLAARRSPTHQRRQRTGIKKTNGKQPLLGSSRQARLGLVCFVGANPRHLLTNTSARPQDNVSPRLRTEAIGQAPLVWHNVEVPSAWRGRAVPRGGGCEDRFESAQARQ